MNVRSTISTKHNLIQKSVRLLAREGYTGTSMRKVADAAGVKPSLIYNYFTDKEALLREVRFYIIDNLDQGLATLNYTQPASQLLRDMLVFQFAHRTKIVALLQYFIGMSRDFPITNGGYVPERAYVHIKHVIQKGVAENRYFSQDIDTDSKIIAHSVNGFLLEYAGHPMKTTEIEAICTSLHGFIERSLMYRGQHTEGAV